MANTKPIGVGSGVPQFRLGLTKGSNDTAIGLPLLLKRLEPKYDLEELKRISRGKRMLGGPI
jgi:hypothetical protein